MALRYTAEHLLFLRESPLCSKPDKLPPAEDWMGVPAEQVRTQNKSIDGRPRSIENPLLDQTNRRSGINHASRNSTNPDDIVFAPPRMAFASSGRGGKSSENEKTPKDADSQGRFNLRRNGESDGDRLRVGNPIRRRGDSDLDGEGWSTVKPRKSFGAEGAERFHGRMGGNYRDEKKQPRDADRDAPRERPARPFESFNREKEAEVEGRVRNGGRSKIDSWHKGDSSDASALPEKKERDRTKSWRDRDATETADDRGNTRATDRRWGRDRDQRAEREPEWVDEPAEPNREAHTQQDFQKWMESMKKAKGNGSATEKESTTMHVETEIVAEKVSVQSSVQPTPTAETAPDKFFLAFGSKTSLDVTSPAAEQPEAAPKPKATGKSSRFTSFFHQAQEEPPRPKVEQSISVPPSALFPPGFGAPPGHGPPVEEEKQAFQQLLAKLQKQSLSATPPGPSAFAPPQGIPMDTGKKSNLASPEPFQQYGDERLNGPMGRPPPHHVQEILAPRPQQQSARPEQLLQDLVGHHQRISSQGSGRPDQTRNNSNTEFLMNLMRAGPGAPLSMPSSQPQPPLPKPQQMPEPDFSPRDSRGGQRQMRPGPPPGFPMDDSFHNVEREGRPTQPTQILQRPPPPPGLDQMPPSWMTSGGQMPPPQQRGPMMPPPGLPGGMNRNVPLPHMFPPNFPPGGMPPPDALGGMPPRNMPPPPPGFFNGPPHGFMPPGLGFNGPPPEAFSAPFEGRGMPPQGNGRGAAYGRP